MSTKPITIDEINDNPLRVLTLNEPFASLASFHDKQETRTRATKVRGLVAIHAAAKAYPAGVVLNISGWEQYQRISAVRFNPEHQGKILSIGRLVDCQSMNDYQANKITIENKTFVKFHYGLFIWFFEDVTPIVPVPWRGKQGWGIYPNELKSLIKLI